MFIVNKKMYKVIHIDFTLCINYTVLMPNKSSFPDSEAYNAYMRDYRAKNRAKLREYNRVYNSSWRKANGYKNELSWQSKHPERVAAQRKARYALKIGLISKTPCNFCGSEEVVAHHPDYNKPIEVVWVCKVHHREIHYG